VTLKFYKTTNLPLKLFKCFGFEGGSRIIAQGRDGINSHLYQL